MDTQSQVLPCLAAGRQPLCVGIPSLAQIWDPRSLAAVCLGPCKGIPSLALTLNLSLQVVQLRHFMAILSQVCTAHRDSLTWQSNAAAYCIGSINQQSLFYGGSIPEVLTLGIAFAGSAFTSTPASIAGHPLGSSNLGSSDESLRGHPVTGWPPNSHLYPAHCPSLSSCCSSGFADGTAGSSMVGSGDIHSIQGHQLTSSGGIGSVQGHPVTGSHLGSSFMGSNVESYQVRIPGAFLLLHTSVTALVVHCACLSVIICSFWRAGGHHSLSPRASCNVQRRQCLI